MTMNISSYASEFTTQLSQISPSSIPSTLWAYYLTYLVFYEPDSWVAKIAYACRILALLIALPIIILALLDLASYGIARSLGVIDDVKASTSDKSTIHVTAAPQLQPPLIQVNGIDTPASESTFSSDSDRDSISLDHTHHNRMLRSPLSASMTEDEVDTGSQPSLYYVGEDSSKLSGVGVFSPAASMPSSPTISRYNLAYNPANNTKTDATMEHSLRHRTPLNALAPLKESADDH